MARTYVTERMAETLGLKTTVTHQMHLKQFGKDTTIQFDSANITFNIRHESTFLVPITANTTLHITDHIPMFMPQQFLQRYPAYEPLPLADIGKS